MDRGPSHVPGKSGPTHLIASHRIEPVFLVTWRSIEAIIDQIEEKRLTALSFALHLRLPTFTFHINPMDHSVTIFWKHNLIPGKIMMIFGMPGRDNEESNNGFVNSKMIARNPKSIFAKIKNTFGKTKNQNDLSVNRFFVPKNRLAGNNLQEAVNGIKFCGNILKNHENILKSQSMGIMIAGNKLKDH